MLVKIGSVPAKLLKTESALTSEKLLLTFPVYSTSWLEYKLLACTEG